VPADGAVTGLSGLACTVMVADCLPVLLCNAKGSRVAAAHAGWRGLLGVQGAGVLESAVASFGQSGTRNADDLMAWLGPCIGPGAFEVGDEVRAAFVAASPQAADCFRPNAPGKWLADLPALARQRLYALGLTRTYGNDGSADWCTVTNASRFFSHRRDAISGRLAACIWRLG
jgi:YfiH family protein